jgi:DNA-binding GntR family transcriptional regulator
VRLPVPAGGAIAGSPSPDVVLSTITGQTLDQWKSGTAAQRVAADIAGKISSGAWVRWRELPPADFLAAQHDVSSRTASRARKLLLDGGLLGRDGRIWYVA